MKVLITGSAGLVGSTFVRSMSEHDLTLIDIAQGIDAADFFRRCETHFDLVIHCAATVGGRKTIDLAPEKLFNNFVLDSELFQFALRTRPKKIVYFSSSAAYPMYLQTKDSGHKLVESDIELDYITQPDPSIYGVSKLTGEVMANHASSKGLNIWVFRPFSGYSEWQSLDYPFPSFIDRAKRRDDPFEVWSTGEQVRDWIHMQDIVDAVLTILDNAPPDVYNLSSGVGTSMNQLVDRICRTVGYLPTIEHVLDAPLGVMYRVGDNSKMLQYYTPRISLDQGIRRALEN